LPFIDTTDIKQIEVLKGPASVLYGTDAISGVVQLISKTPEKTQLL
jgi:vitamin B12 transporter